MLGVLVNVAAVIVGSLIGMLIKKGLPDRISNAMTTAVAMIVIYIGIDGMMSGENTLILVLSIVIGGLTGTLLNLDHHLQTLGNIVESRFKNSDTKIAEGFVTASLLFCVGAFTVVGALQSGLTGNHEMQFTKALLDLISSLVLASALGLGVMLAAFSVFFIQGGIVLLAHVIAPLLSEYAVNEITCVGSVLIFALGLNLLGLTKIKLMNFTPAIFVPIILCIFM